MSGYILVFVSLTLRPVRLFGAPKKNGLRVEYVSGNTASVSNHFRGSEQSYPIHAVSLSSHKYINTAFYKIQVHTPGYFQHLTTTSKQNSGIFLLVVFCCVNTR